MIVDQDDVPARAWDHRSIKALSDYGLLVAMNAAAAQLQYAVVMRRLNAPAADERRIDEAVARLSDQLTLFEEELARRSARRSYGFQP